MTYRYVKSAWTDEKKPDKIEVVSSFITPAGFLKSLAHEDYVRLFGDEYEKSRKYSHKQVETLTAGGGEYDACIQITFLKDGEPITMAQINLLQCPSSLINYSFVAYLHLDDFVNSILA